VLPDHFPKIRDCSSTSKWRGSSDATALSNGTAPEHAELVSFSRSTPGTPTVSKTVDRGEGPAASSALRSGNSGNDCQELAFTHFSPPSLKRPSQASQRRQSLACRPEMMLLVGDELTGSPRSTNIL
jgi:hypothetical protein